MKGDLGGQDLGGRGRGHEAIGVLLEEHAAGLGIHEDRERCDGLESLAGSGGRVDQAPEQDDGKDPVPQKSMPENRHGLDEIMLCLIESDQVRAVSAIRAEGIVV